MIAALTGKITRKAADYVIVDVSGIGYQVYVPLSTFCSLPDPGGAVSLHIHTHLREESLSLFGFLTEPEKEMFLLLMNVSGIGPKLALAVLSSIPVADLCCALSAGDASTLCSVPGIGKKTAARMILELKEKIPALQPEAAASPAMPTRSGDHDDVVSALVNLGYKKPQAEEAVRQVRQQMPGLAVEALIREVLSSLLKR